MDKLDYLLIKVAEESSEVGQAVSKCLRFGLSEVEPGKDGTDNLERLRLEITDLIAAWEDMCDEAEVDNSIHITDIYAAKTKSKRWLEFTEELGRLS